MQYFFSICLHHANTFLLRQKRNIQRWRYLILPEPLSSADKVYSWN